MKIVNKVFPLTISANRLALLGGVLSGTVGDKEVESAMIADSGKRAYRKPVRAEGIYFESVTEAAKVLVSMRKARMSGDEFFRAVQSEQHRISRKCNQDCHDGYYWEN